MQPVHLSVLLGATACIRDATDALKTGSVLEEEHQRGTCHRCTLAQCCVQTWKWQHVGADYHLHRAERTRLQTQWGKKKKEYDKLLSNFAAKWSCITKRLCVSANFSTRHTRRPIANPKTAAVTPPRGGVTHLMTDYGGFFFTTALKKKKTEKIKLLFKTLRSREAEQWKCHCDIHLVCAL